MAENWNPSDYVYFAQNATCKEFILRIKAAFALCSPTPDKIKI